jgi:hypothetical protein
VSSTVPNRSLASPIAFTVSVNVASEGVPLFVELGR